MERKRSSDRRTQSTRTPVARPSSDPAPPRVGDIRFHPIHRTGNLLALVSVRFGDHIDTHGWRLVQAPGQRPWVGVPANSKEVDDPETGQRRKNFYPVLEIPTSWRKAVETAVLAKWAEREEVAR